MKDSLKDLMQAYLPVGGICVPGARESHMEILELATGQVWMSLEVVTQEDFAGLALGDEYVPVGIGSANMDAALFQYSPNAQDEPVRQRRISGYDFINVAQPGEMISPVIEGGCQEISVNKAHVLGYEAGSRVSVLHTAKGDYVGVVGTSERDAQLNLLEGERIEQYTLQQHWVVPLPVPTQTLWWFEGGMRSFQGPVTLPVDDMV